MRRPPLAVRPWGGLACAAGLALAVLCALAAPAGAQRGAGDPREAFSQQFAAQGAEGRILRRITLTCDIPRCEVPAQKAQLDRLLRLEPGRPVQVDQVADAWSRLRRTGLFRTVTVTATPVAGVDPPVVDLTFHGEGVVVITELTIEYADWRSSLYPRQFRTEVRKRLRFRKGGPFPPKPADGVYGPSDQRDIDAQRRAIEKLYVDQGYDGTAVELRPVYSADGKTVTLTVVVSEGRQPLFGGVLLAGNTHFSYNQVTSYLSTGERAHFWPQFFSVFGVGRFDERLLKEELKAVEARYREEGYVSARVRLAGDAAREGPRAWPRVRVREGPHVEVRFVGNAHIDDEDLRAVLTFAESGAWDDTEVQASALAIADAYQARARYNAAVEPEVERLSRDAVRITFNIVEGEPVYIAQVRVHGARTLPADRILAAMQTRGVAPDGVINSLNASAGVLQDARLINDLITIRDLYRDEGMPLIRFRCAPESADLAEWNSLRLTHDRWAREQAEAAAPRRRRPTVDPLAPRPFGPPIDASLFAGRLDVWSDDPVAHRCFWVEPLRDKRLVVVHIELAEGLRTHTNGLDVIDFLKDLDPAEQDDAWELFESLGLADETGRFTRSAGLNKAKLQSVQGFLLRALHRDGYLKATVQPSCVTAQGAGPCDTNRLYGEALSTVHFDIERGVRTRVDGLLMNGNLRTQPQIIRNEIVLKDRGPLGTEALFLSQANLRSLGIFDAVRVETLSDGGTDAPDGERRAAVMVTVEEGRYQVLDALLGLQVDSSPVGTDNIPVLYTGSLSLRDRNFLGRALEVGLGANHANRIDAPQDIEGDYASWEVGPFLKDRRFFGTRLNLNTELTFRQGRTAQRDAYQQLGRLEAVLGYDFYNLSYPDRWGQGLRATISNEFRAERRRGLSVNDERPPFGDVTLSVNVQPALTWDKRDNPLHPSRGWFLNLSSEALVTAEADAALSFREILIGQSVHSFFRKRLIVVPSLRIGAIQTDQPEADLRADFLFKAGGDGVVLPVRGYADASIDACGGRRRNTWCADALPDAGDVVDVIPTVGGRAMVLGSLELRWPTFLLEDFWFTAFSDVGAVSAEWRSMNPDRFHPSVGGGLRWLVTGQIPLRIDVAYPLRGTVFAPQETRVHFNIFYTL